MCGRYALGAAHQDFLEGLQQQYRRLFPRRSQDDDNVAHSDPNSSGRPLRLRGGGPGGDEPVASSSSQTDAHSKIDFHAAEQPGRPKWEREQDFWPSYNIAPRQRAPVVRRDAETGDAMIETMQWGLIPHWTKYPPTGPLNTINARSEALIDPSSGGMWHALKGYKRCVIPAQGYYEWQKKGTTKVAHFVRLQLDQGTTQSNPPILFFAGLWDTVKYVDPVPSRFVPKEGDDREPYPTGNPVPLATYTIVTTTPAADIAWLHNREPCILTNEDEIARWLDLGETPVGWKDGKGGTGDLLHSYPNLDVYPVLPEVGKIGKSELAYILPVAERTDGIKSFFAKAKPKEPTTPQKPVGKGPPLLEEKKLDSGMATVKHESSIVKEERKPSLEDSKPSVKDSKPSVKDSKPSVKDSKPSVKDEGKLGSAEELPLVPPKDSKQGVKEKVKPIPDDVVMVLDDDEEEVKPVGTAKRKRADEPRKGGRQTKVVRQAPADEPKKGQSSITSFFKSPGKKG